MKASPNCCLNAVFQSVPSTVLDPVKPTEVDMESGSRASETDIESLFSSAPQKVKCFQRSRFKVAVRFCASTRSETICSHPIRVHCFGRSERAMKVPPVFLRGAHKSAMRAKDCEWHEDTKSVVVCRRWKLFVLLPRILLFRLVRGGRVPKNQLLDRFQNLRTESGFIAWD